MDVLLLNTNVTRCARSGYGPTPPPAGLISLAGVLRRLGHRVSIHQLTAHVLPQDDEGLPLLVEELRPIIAAHRPTLIGISARNIGAARRPANPFRLIEYYSAFYDARVVRALRKLSDMPIVIGGTAFSLEPALYLRYVRPDFGLLGEAEESLPTLVAALEAGAEPAGIQGLVRVLEDTLPERRTYGRVADLSVMGPGACDAVADFRRHYYDGGGLAPIQTKRGCAMNCIYCAVPCVEGHTYRFRPTEHVIAEIEAYRRGCGVSHFFFVDNTFNHPPQHAVRVCDAIVNAGLGIEWFAELTPAAVTDELCAAMSRSGCIGVTLTPDSCCDEVLEAYQKGFDVEQLRRAVALLKEHGIPFDTCLIVGGPGETRQTLADSVAFCREYLRDGVVRFYDGMVITTLAPVFRIAAQEGLVDPHRRYEDIVLSNDFRAIRKFDYLFPHVGQGRDKLLAFVDEQCRGRRWLLTSRDYGTDALTGELSLRPEVSVGAGDRPWWKNLARKDFPACALMPET